jgi:N-carbamoyl-L-amino-acid hydrolase
MWFSAIERKATVKCGEYCARRSLDLLNSRKAKNMINAQRLLADHDSFSRIGENVFGGIDRIAGSKADMEGRRWLAGRLDEAGLSSRVDAVGNVFGFVPGTVGPWLLIGSHGDTVPNGGRFDGAFGTISALEVLRTLRESADARAPSVAMVSFYNEEGVISGSDGGLVGSRSLCNDAYLHRMAGFLELHVEQSSVLATSRAVLGVVSKVVTVVRHLVQVDGAPAHGGTSPFEKRRDAGAVACRIGASFVNMLQEIDPALTGNVGAMQFSPGAPNVVPGSATLSVELRAPDEELLRAAKSTLRRRFSDLARESGCTATWSPVSTFPCSDFDPQVCAMLEDVCRDSGDEWRYCLSYAGHDASLLSHHLPTGMLFVPSEGGISHSPLEHTKTEHLVAGCRALYEASRRLASVLCGQKRFTS